MSRLTLLQIVPTLSGGLARATLDAAQAVIASGGTAIVASPGGALLNDLLRLRATHLELPEVGTTPWTKPGLPGRLAASLGGSDIDVIQARSPASAVIAGALARKLGTKWIATLHRPLSSKGLMRRFTENRQSLADAVVAVSDYVARDALQRFGALGERLHTLPPGINLDRFDPAIVRADRVIKLAGELRVPDGRLVVLCPGRFLEDRGQKALIRAIKLLARDDVFCLLLGSADAPTPFEKELEQTIEAEELHGKVQIGPYVEDMPAAYMLADVVVTTGGPNQGFSRPVIEAQAMGRPVVAEEGGGAAEAIQPGVTGWLAGPDDPASLAASIAHALSLSAEQRAEYARTAQEGVRGRFDLVQTNRDLLGLYERLAG
ncbi:MAG TPA: glycosyltransferase family 4 protein [Reyranella sp.]|nr:glycosyltransferase family 4 protein [Reyranella sp.]